MKDIDRKYYGRYAEPLEESEQWLIVKLQDILDQISMDSESRPAEHVLSRIKESESVRDKMKKKQEDPSPENALRILSDIIGVRIVVHFVGDVYEILTKIQHSPDWEVEEVKDYIERPKQNGYRSLHVILSIPFEEDTLKAEVQIRTIAMDCWASLEHQLRYKKNIDHPELIENELSRCAAQMASTDLTLQTIRDMIQEG